MESVAGDGDTNSGAAGNGALQMAATKASKKNINAGNLDIFIQPVFSPWPQAQPRASPATHGISISLTRQLTAAI